MRQQQDSHQWPKEDKTNSSHGGEKLRYSLLAHVMESRQEERAKPGLKPESRTIKLGELFVLQLAPCQVSQIFYCGKCKGGVRAFQRIPEVRTSTTGRNRRGCWRVIKADETRWSRRHKFSGRACICWEMMIMALSIYPRPAKNRAQEKLPPISKFKALERGQSKVLARVHLR